MRNITKLSFLLILFLFAISCVSTKRTINKSASLKVKKTSKKNSNEKAESPLSKNDSLAHAYIEKYVPIAQEEMDFYHIPSSITLAQGLLESGVGKSRLATEGNNHFGIKCHTRWTGRKMYQDDDEKGECFRVYDDPSKSYRDHSLFLAKRSRYQFLFDLEKDDYEGWAKGLKKAGYATDPKYPSKLISLIERYELHRFDEKEKTSDEEKEDVLIEGGLIKSNEIVEKNEGESNSLSKGIDAKETATVVIDKRPNKKKTKKVKKITHTVSIGETVYSLSRRYNTSIKSIIKENNIVDNIIQIGAELIIPIIE